MLYNIFKLGKKGKRILLALILSAILINVNINKTEAELTMGLGTNPDIVVRVGEYGNENYVKQGKRAYVDKNTKVPRDIPLRHDEHGYYISEFDINKKLATRIAQKISQKGIKVDLQISTEKYQDLNYAGRWASGKNPEIYFSTHHNAYAKDSSGYFFMVNDKDYTSEKYAQQLSDSIVNNPLNIPQMKNRINDGYIGEMNEVGNRTNAINILGEFGFFSNQDELMKIIDDTQVEYVSDKISEELINILNNL